ncbi:unnamed protein product [Rotaria sordida]|uniref:Caspase family p20 domain-containing protein n=1 Tax=Rotaria sordida TaxID=392033 RepID=A0A814I9F7_9BILA|nr:unnamed protein product [Rotaria sordida]
MATKEKPRRKLALVIGIGKYDHCEELQNPENDANDMSSALESIDFNVTKRLHLRRAEMQRVLIDFENSIEQDDMVLFYFAGHGIQWEDQNYLIPKDTPTLNGAVLNRCAINAQDIIDTLSDRNPYVTIFLLDCCRKYHLCNPEVDARDPDASGSKSVGLKPMHKAGSLIAFACAPGTIAIEGKGQKNGLFTKHLLKHTTSVNEDIQMILRDVAKGVTQESKSKQIPFMQSQIENQRSVQRTNRISINRSDSSQLVDFHVYIIPKRTWKNCQPLIENEVMKHVISAGFVPVPESLTLDELRQYIIDICGEESYFPKKFIYLRSVGRFLIKVKHNEEKELKLKNFQPPMTIAPEIYILEEHYNDDSCISKQRTDFLLRELSISESLISSQSWIKSIDGPSLIYPLFNHYQLPRIHTVTRTLSKNLLKLHQEQERLYLYQKQLARKRREIENQHKKEKAVTIIRTASRTYRYRHYTKQQ